MRIARVKNLIEVSSLPNQDKGSQPVYKVTTDWEKDKQNSFYMDRCDKEGVAVGIATTSAGVPNDPNTINWDDEIVFDKKDGLVNTCAIWRGRKFRQRGYSFDKSK